MKKINLLFLFMMLSGCVALSNYPPLAVFNADYPLSIFRTVNISSMYYEKLYINSVFVTKENNEISSSNISRLSLCLDGTEECNDYGKIVMLDFYQDAEKTCFLFSKTNRELRELYNYMNRISPNLCSGYDLFFQRPVCSEAEKKEMNDNIILMVTKDDIVAISKRIYDELKLVALSHSYDPSLCKPKPSNE